MKSKKDNKQSHEIEVIYSSEPTFEISAVNDCANDLRPKKAKSKKKTIIPKEKKGDAKK